MLNSAGLFNRVQNNKQRGMVSMLRKYVGGGPPKLMT